MIITFCCFGVFIISILMMLKASDLFDKKRKRKEIYRWVSICFGIFAIIMVPFVFVGSITADFQTDTKERTITIVDKWHENGNYYFTDENGNIYKMSYDWYSEYKYDNTPYKRHKDLFVNEKYTIEIFYVLGMEECSYGRSLNEIRMR